MSQLRPYNDNELLDRVVSHARGFDDWLPGVYDIWVRKSKKSSEVDVFTDKVFTYEVGESRDPQFRMVCTGTSITGSWALKSFRTYNRNGAAILQSDRFVRNSHAYGFHKAIRAYEQVKAFPFYRDADFDLVAEETGTLYTNEIIKANCHPAKRNAISRIIYNWSAACPVRNNWEQWLGWFAFMNKRPLSLTILKEF